MKCNSVKKLTDNNLCYQCGTCKSICPTWAITMEKYADKGYIYPNINNDKCINCGKCLKVCPINNIDCKENHLPTDNQYIGIYNSRCKERIDYTASGGIATETIKYLFDNKIINKAIVAGMSTSCATSSQAYVITSITELKDISGSVYQPVSLNEVLDTITEDDRVVLVGLSCHIRGLELFLKQKPILSNSFVFKIGLICTIGRGKHGTNLTISKTMKINDEDNIKKVIYRYGMPPGNFQVYLKNGELKEISCMKFLQNTDFIFMPKGCLFCTDLFNDKADMTVGDPWGLNKGKKVMCIIRNNALKEILDKMLKKELIEFDSEISNLECIKTQQHSVNYKINNYPYRISAYKKLGISCPDIKNIEYKKNNPKQFIGYNLLMISSKVFNSKFGLMSTKALPENILYKFRNRISGINCSKRCE